MERLKRRSDFRAVARGRKFARPGFVLQVRPREGAAADAPRMGFTVTRQMGNAVARNRIRRRLREAVRVLESEPHGAASASDYVLVARRPALTLPFDRLVADLKSGFAALSPDGQAATRSRNAR